MIKLGYKRSTQSVDSVYVIFLQKKIPKIKIWPKVSIHQNLYRFPIVVACMQRNVTQDKKMVLTWQSCLPFNILLKIKNKNRKPPHLYDIETCGRIRAQLHTLHMGIVSCLYVDYCTLSLQSEYRQTHQGQHIDKSWLHLHIIARIVCASLVIYILMNNIAVLPFARECFNHNSFQKMNVNKNKLLMHSDRCTHIVTWLCMVLRYINQSLLSVECETINIQS